MPTRRRELKRELVRMSGPGEVPLPKIPLSEIIQLLGPQLASKCRVLIWKDRNHSAGVQEFDHNRIGAPNGTVSNGTDDIWNPRRSVLSSPWGVKNTNLTQLYSLPLTMFVAFKSVKSAAAYGGDGMFQTFFAASGSATRIFFRLHDSAHRFQVQIRNAGTIWANAYAETLGAFPANTKILSAFDVNSAGGQWHVNGIQEYVYGTITPPPVSALAHWGIGYGNVDYAQRPGEVVAVNGLFDILTATEKATLTALESIRALL